MKKIIYSLMICFAAVLQISAIPIIQPDSVVWEYDYEKENPNFPYTQRHYDYDEQGRVTLIEQSRSTTDEDGTPYFGMPTRFEYTYGPYGMLTRVIRAYNESKREYYQSTKWEYIYNSDGLLTRFNSYRKTSLDTYHLYFYNDSKQLIRETQYNNIGQVTINETFAYDSLGRISELNSTMSGHVYFTYDADGNEIQTDTYYDDVLTLRLYHTYDAEGHELTFLRQENVNGQGLVDYSTGEYTYNEHGDLIREKVHFYVTSDGIYRNDDWDLVYSYQYDGLGRMTRYENEEHYYIYSYDIEYPLALKNTSVEADIPVKILKDGRVLIQKGGYLYDALGRPVARPAF